MAGTLTEIIDNGGLRSQREGINSDLTRVFKVAGLTGGTGAEAETEAISGFPADGSTYGIAPYANLKKFSHSFEWQNTAKTEGLVTVRYRTPSNTRTQTGAPGDRSPIITWGTQLESRTFIDDYSDPPKQYVNTAGQPFDPPPTTLVGVPYIEVTVWKTSSQFTGTVVPLISQCPIVNSASFTIDGVAFGARKLLATVERAEKEFEDTETYYRVSYRFLVNNDNWDLKLRSYGYYEKDISGKWKPILDTEGSLVTRPFPLDPDGAAASDASSPGAQMTFRPYRVVSFTGLF